MCLGAPIDQAEHWQKCFTTAPPGMGVLLMVELTQYHKGIPQIVHAPHALPLVKFTF